MGFIELGGGGLAAALGIIIAAAAAVPIGLKYRKSRTARPEYTEEDKDFMELIGELAAVYENTDKYLNGD